MKVAVGQRWRSTVSGDVFEVVAVNPSATAYEQVTLDVVELSKASEGEAHGIARREHESLGCGDDPNLTLDERSAYWLAFMRRRRTNELAWFEHGAAVLVKGAA